MFLFFLFGCTEEEFLNPSTEKEVTEQVIEPTNHSNGIVLKSLTFDEYPHQETVLNKLENIHKPRLNLNTTIVATDNTSSNPVLNGLSVIQEYSKYIEYPSGHHTYTFDTERESPNGRFENIVLVSNGQEGYDAFLVQYDVTEQEKEQILNGEDLDIDSRIIIHPITKEEQNELMQANEESYYYGGGCFGTRHDGGTIISCPPIPSYDWEFVWDSGGGSSGSGGSSGGFSGSPGSNSGGGSGTGTYSNPFATNPISAFDEALDDLRDCMAGDSGITPIFTTEQTDLMNNNLDFVNELLEVCKSSNESNISFEDLLLMLGKKRECRKISELFFLYPEFKTKLQNLANNAPTATQEQGFGIDENGNDIDFPTAGEGFVAPPPNPANKYRAMAHLHDTQGLDGNGTYSVFSLGDLAFTGSVDVLHSKIQINKFVSFLATAKGTYYAFTISNPYKFRTFFEYWRYNYPYTPEQVESIEAKNEIAEKYYDGGNPLIVEENEDNNEMLKQFLKFLDEADMGITVFKTDENFNDFDLVEYDESTDNVNFNNPCEQ